MVLCIISAIIGALRLSIDYWNTFKDCDNNLIFNTRLAAVWGTVLGFMIGVIISCLASVIGMYAEKNDIVIEQEIYEIENSNTVSGVSFLEIDYVDDRKVYQYVVDTGQKKKMVKINVPEVYIHEGDYDPHMKIQKYGKYKKDWYSWFICNLLEDKIKRVDFYVPNGTVMRVHREKI